MAAASFSLILFDDRRYRSRFVSFIWAAGVRPYQVFPKRRMIPHPSCEVCDADMWLTCIEPDKPGHDKRTFECPRCQHVKFEIVNYGEQNE